MPRSSSTLTSEASLKRGGGWVKCCSCSSFSSSSLFTWSRLGSLLRGLVVLVLLLFRNFVDLQESVEAHHRPADAEVIRLAGLRRNRGNLRRGYIEDRRHHLRSHKALPDQPVELELLFGQVAGDRLRRPRSIGGTNRFVRILRGLFALVRIGCRGQILRAQTACRSTRAPLRSPPAQRAANRYACR